MLQHKQFESKQKERKNILTKQEGSKIQKRKTTIETDLFKECEKFGIIYLPPYENETNAQLRKRRKIMRDQIHISKNKNYELSNDRDIGTTLENIYESSTSNRANYLKKFYEMHKDDIQQKYKKNKENVKANYKKKQRKRKSKLSKKQRKRKSKLSRQ